MLGVDFTGFVWKFTRRRVNFRNIHSVCCIKIKENLDSVGIINSFFLELTLCFSLQHLISNKFLLKRTSGLDF